MSDNLSLWNSVCKTDPAFTKPVSYGKRRFTAIDPQYQLREATRVWGKYGETWGLQDFFWTVIESGEDKELCLDADFFYPGENAHFPVSVSMKFRVGDDTRTKLITHARSKALSMLGFSADVFMGKFDDNKYVQSLADQYNEQSSIVNKAVAAYRVARDQERLSLLWERVTEHFAEGRIDESAYDDLRSVHKQAEKRIAAQGGNGEDDADSPGSDQD